MAKNRKYIIGSGIAISPEKDMALFKKMSKQGWHLSGFKLWWFRFDKGEPANYDYASNMEMKVTKEMLSLYEKLYCKGEMSNRTQISYYYRMTATYP